MTEKNFTVNSGLVVKNGLTVEGGTIDFTGASSGGGVELTDFSATTAAAGTTGLAYDNTTGVFTYTPADLSSYATTASLATVATSGAYSDLTGTPSLSGYLTNITGESLYSLSNVYTSSSPTDGQVLTWDNANSYWKPTTISSGSSFAGADYFKINPALVSAASATGSDALSAGRGGQGSGDYSTQVGSAGFITTAGDYGTAYGWNAHVQAVGGQAFGTMAGVSANENYSTALGYNARTTAANQLMLGNTTGNGAFTSILVGNSSYTPTQTMDLTTKDYVDTAVAGAGGGGSTPQEIAFGNSGSAATSSGTRSMAIGSGATTGSSSYSVALGRNATADNASGFGIAIGNTADAAASYSVVIGAASSCNASATSAVCIGDYVSTGSASTNSVNIGNYAYSNGAAAIAIGRYSDAFAVGVAVGGGSSSTNRCYAAASAVAVGAQAYAGNSFAVAIGRYSTTGSASDAVSLGYNSSCTSSYQFTLGNSSVNNLRCADTSITAISDSRDKREVTDLTLGLDFVNAVSPKTFFKNSRSAYYEEDYTPEQLLEDETLEQSYTFNQADYDAGTKKADKREFGFIAQDVAAELPSDYSDVRLTYNETEDVYGYNVQRFTMGDMTPILWKALRELSDKHDQLQSDYDALLARVVALENA